MAQDKLKTFKGVFLKESASTRTMILSILFKSNERSEVEVKYNTKTTQEDLYQKPLKLIRGLISSNASRS